MDPIHLSLSSLWIFIVLVDPKGILLIDLTSRNVLILVIDCFNDSATLPLRADFFSCSGRWPLLGLRRRRRNANSLLARISGRRSLGIKVMSVSSVWVSRLSELTLGNC